MVYCLLWQPPTCLHFPSNCMKNGSQWYPMEHFLANTGTYWQERLKTHPLPQVQKSHWQQKNAVCQYKFDHRKERFAHLKHDSNGSSKIWMKLWYQLCWSILSLVNLRPPQDWCNPTSDCMALIAKGCGLRPTRINKEGNYCNTPSYSRRVHRSKIVWPYPNFFSPCLLHLPHIQNFIFIMKFPICIPTRVKDFIKAIARHVLVPPKRGSCIYH